MEIIKLIDTKLFFFINHGLRNVFLDYLMALLTDVGSGRFVFGAGVILLFLGKKDLKVLGILMMAGGFVSNGVISLLKPAFKVMRPCFALDNVRCFIYSYGYSFPSGHSSLAFTCATILASRLNKIIFYGLAGVVAISRVYLGVHYLSDILVGAAIGFSIGYFLITLYNYEQTAIIKK